MTAKSKTILFFGTEDFSAYTLTALIANGFSIGAIITKPDSRRGRHSDLIKPQVKQIGETNNIPVWQPTKLRDIADDIKQFVDPVGVLVSYGKIIPQAIIDLFSPGIINLHPSLLPLYRGPSPIESAILAGDSSTGISIMQLSAAMDAGPVYLQETVPLENTETALELYESLGKRGATLLVNALPAILDGTLIAQPQDNSYATYCHLIQKSDGMMNWHKSAYELERQVRAYTPWPGCRTRINGIDVLVTHAHVTPASFGEPGDIKLHTDSLLVQTTSHALEIDVLKPIGKKEMPIQAFLAGYRSRLS